MATYRAPLEDMRFTLFDNLRAQEMWPALRGTGEVDQETAEAILDEAARFCENVVAPLNREADEHGCRLVDGKVQTPPGFREAYREFCDAGWCGLGGDPRYGGMGMPKSLAAAVEEMLQGSCMAFGLAPMLTSGAGLAIETHASAVLKDLYLPRLYSGQWSGAMDLTEPQAGTDLGLVRTMAEPLPNDAWKISGSKIFITWGEHDMAENIVHLVLARTPDAPAGVKGISLFLVPKFLPDADGNCGERNLVTCGALEHKMGIKGAATCVMNYDGAKGWLIGNVHEGLANMFTMMNYERLVVGVQAVGVAERSYQTALQYAADRLQGRGSNPAQRSGKQADPIIVHPDVRRMLMTMKAYTEASRAFYVYAAGFLDLARFGADADRQAAAQQMVALLTPVAKAFMTDMAFDSAVLGQQILGGHGYIREWGQEQNVRDLRITQIYEGTNGIQALDLIGRKTIHCKGAFLQALAEEVRHFQSANASYLERTGLGEPLQQAFDTAVAVTDELLQSASENPELAGAVAYDYMLMLGHAIYAYMWARAACAAAANESAMTDRQSSKVKTAQFFCAKCLPLMAVYAHRIRSGSAVVMSCTLDELGL